LEVGRGEGGEKGGREGDVGWSPLCEILNTPLTGHVVEIYNF